MGTFLSKCCRKGRDERHGYVHIDGNNHKPTYSEQYPMAGMRVKPLHQAQKKKKMKKLESFFRYKFISNAPVNFSIQEIHDIQIAVKIMLERIRTRVNSRGVFKITRIVPTGSMVEETAIWKYDDDKRETYLEFDNLAVLKESVRLCEDHGDHSRCCRGCIRMRNLHVKLTLLPQHLLFLMHGIDPSNGRIDKVMINEIFLYEINDCLASSCDCLHPHHGGPYSRSYSFRPSSVDKLHGCDRCTVHMPTGTLSVNTSKTVSALSSSPNKCSLILLWTSKTNSLLAPDELLKQKQPITSLPIYIDFLPALESLKPTSPSDRYTHDYFVVPKSCNLCYKIDHKYRWRISWCMAEIEAFKTKMSEKHLRCYQIIKYLAKDSEFTHVNKYLIKNVVLQHSKTCSDTSDNYVDCVIKVYQDIVNAYNRMEFLSYRSKIDILSNFDHNVCKINEAYYQSFLTKLYSVSETDAFDRFVSRLWSSSESAARDAWKKEQLGNDQEMAQLAR